MPATWRGTRRERQQVAAVQPPLASPLAPSSRQEMAQCDTQTKRRWPGLIRPSAPCEMTKSNRLSVYVLLRTRNLQVPKRQNQGKRAHGHHDSSLLGAATCCLMSARAKLLTQSRRQTLLVPLAEHELLVALLPLNSQLAETCSRISIRKDESERMSTLSVRELTCLRSICPHVAAAANHPNEIQLTYDEKDQSERQQPPDGAHDHQGLWRRPGEE